MGKIRKEEAVIKPFIKKIYKIRKKRIAIPGSNGQSDELPIVAIVILWTLDPSPGTLDWLNVPRVPSISGQ
jgi:hypothetical protein